MQTLIKKARVNLNRLTGVVQSLEAGAARSVIGLFSHMGNYPGKFKPEKLG